LYRRVVRRKVDVSKEHISIFRAEKSYSSILFYPEDGSDMLLQSVGALSELHGVTSQKTVLLTVTAVIISNPTSSASNLHGSVGLMPASPSKSSQGALPFVVSGFTSPFALTYF
jgi:hypothetical protein